MRSALLSCLTFCLLAALSGSAAGAAKERPREPFFPRAGNVGYDVANYKVDLTFRAGSGKVRALAMIGATATQRLSRFSLDLFGMRVTEVSVDGEPARFNRGRDKLKIEPRTPVRRGERFETLVRYEGRPETVTDPDGGHEGWIETNDGALAVGEPIGTASWLPCNNVPADKASFEIALTVPERLKAVSNGRLVGIGRDPGRRTYVWWERKPMSPYLATVDIGRGRLTKDRIAGLPSWTLIDPLLEKYSLPILAKLPEVIRFEEGIFGPYPFDSAGSIVDFAPGIGYALETQSRPIYLFVPDLTTVVHETAHQWFGNSVGLQRWPNIWLNEGFATWAQWYYAERHDGRSARQIFRALYKVPASNAELWEPPSGHPGTAKNLFATSTYVRGAMALEALRIKVGTKPMLKILRRWATEHRYASANIKQFVALAEEVSGDELGPLFQRWLYQRGKPLPRG
ncbi:MAG: M1 family metallopeptidase [Thermoleophilia bacterium]|nr:M1 family metallopeptidase [Thermoleophilia bacterium]